MQIAKAQVSTGMLAVMTWFMLSDKYTRLLLLHATFTAVKTPIATNPFPSLLHASLRVRRSRAVIRRRRRKLIRVIIRIIIRRR
jgi:hypothetical protein